MSDDPRYCYPASDVLRNLLDIRNSAELNAAERWFSRKRLSENIPRGEFDLSHLKAIHHYIFQDIYAWAGQVREVEISKNGDQFQPRSFIEAGMADVHRRLLASNNLRNLTQGKFAEGVSKIIGDVNYVHPFREGNGRAQLEYLRQIADQAGHQFRPEMLDPTRWVEASRAAHLGDYSLMAKEIGSALETRRTLEELERVEKRDRARADQDRDR